MQHEQPRKNGEVDRNAADEIAECRAGTVGHNRRQPVMELVIRPVLDLGEIPSAPRCAHPAATIASVRSSGASVPERFPQCSARSMLSEISAPTVEALRHLHVTDRAAVCTQAAGNSDILT